MREQQEKPTVRLENWTYFGADERSPFWGRRHVLTGEAYGHPNWPNPISGAPITTSEIMGKRGLLVETQNMLYDLGEPSGKGMSRDELFRLLREVT